MTKPPRELADTIELHLQYLDRYRDIVETKLTGLSETDLRSSRLPSGWSPLDLLKHLVFMERRWLRWGFAAEPVDHPWGDSGDDPDGRWEAGADETLDGLLAKLHEGGAITRRLVTGADPAQANMTRQPAATAIRARRFISRRCIYSIGGNGLVLQH